MSKYIPKTVMFGGKKRNVWKATYEPNKWMIDIEHGYMFVGKAWMIRERGANEGFRAFYHGVEGVGGTFKEAVEDLEAKMVKYFTDIGEVLGYDVES